MTRPDTVGYTAGSGRGVRRLVGEVVRFLAVGGLATLVSVLGFNALVHGVLVDSAPMPDHPVAAYVVANTVAGLLGYAGLRLWAFSHRDVRDDAVASVARFFLLGAATMAIPVLCLAVSRHILGLEGVWADNLSANVIGLGLGTAARFWVFRRYVFTESASLLDLGGS